MSRLEDALQQFDDRPPQCSGRGVVIVADFETILNAWLSIRMLRFFHTALPIELWLADRKALPEPNRWLRLLEKARVRVRFAHEDLQDTKEVTAWSLPLLALMHSEFDEVLSLQSTPLQKIEPLFESREFQETGALFWPSIGSIEAAHPAWKVLDLEACPGRFDSGQMLISKSKNWEVLQLADWIARKEIGQIALAGDRLSVQRDACFLAWNKFGAPYHTPKSHPEVLYLSARPSCSPNGVVQFDFAGRPLFQRRLRPRLSLRGTDVLIPGMLMEATCRAFLAEARQAGIGLSHASSGVAGTDQWAEARRQLLESTWVLTGLPAFADRRDGRIASMSRSQVDPSFKHPFADPSVAAPANAANREIHFSPDGSFGSWSDEYLAGWKLEMVEGQVALQLFMAHAPLGRLRMREAGRWEGSWMSKGRTEPLLLRSFISISSTPGQPASSRLEVRNSSMRLSDHVTAIYACAGAANAGHPVRFYTPFSRWLQPVCHPGLEVVEELVMPGTGELLPAVDLNCFRGQEARLGCSQAGTYARLLGQGVEPARPAKIQISNHARRLEYGDYVLMFPFDVTPALEWPEIHWRRLVVLLRENGLETVMAGTSANAERFANLLNPVCGSWVLDQESEWTLETMMQAAGVVATANAAAHLAGLLGTPCVSLQAQLPASYYWEWTAVEAVLPDVRCAPCHWNFDRGYHPLCELGCSALAAISPERVLERLLKIVRRQGGQLN